MKGKRSKQYRKLMEKYQLTFQFREPYQVLLDSEIITAASRFKMNLGHMLQNTLHGEIKPMITQCSIRHLYNAPNSPDKEGWITVAKAAERRRCGHHELEHPLTELECISSVVDPKGSGSNKFRYVVASQDLEVRRKMREVVGVPLVYIARSVMILEPMADKTERVKEGEEKAKIKAGLKSRWGAAGGEKRKRKREDEDEGGGAEVDGEEPAQKKKKAKGPKGPNPLSVRRAKKEEPAKKNKQVEDERAAIRKATKTDPQAAEKATLATTDAGEDANGVTDGTRKRKRKRKPKDTNTGAEAEAATFGDGDD